MRPVRMLLLLRLSGYYRRLKRSPRPYQRTNSFEQIRHHPKKNNINTDLNKSNSSWVSWVSPVSPFFPCPSKSRISKPDQNELTLLSHLLGTSGICPRPSPRLPRRCR